MIESTKLQTMGRRGSRTQSNRTSQSENVVNDEEMADYDRASQAESGFAALSEAQQDELVKRILRFMHFRHFRKRPVKRAELSSFVFKHVPNIRSKPRVFNGALEQARLFFRTNLGVEIKEIQKLTKRKIGGHSRSTIGTSASQGNSLGYGARGYVLTTNLPNVHRHETPELLCEIGFLTLVAALIALQPGCRIEEETLHHALARLGVYVREKQGHKQLNGGNVKDLLENKFVDMWYLEREKEDNITYFLLGPRLRAEFSDDDLLEFIHAVYKDGPSGHGLLDETGRDEIKARLDAAWGPDGPPEER